MSLAKLTALRSKAEARDLYKARKNHKKRPLMRLVERSHDPEYKKLSIEEFEKKYPIFND